MQNILAIDTANEYLSLALQDKNGREYSFQQKVGNKQTEHILIEINQLLESANLACADLELIVYNQGPGSFTGLRIGLSVALAIAYGVKCNLLPLPAFYLFAETSNTHPYSLVTLDARLQQLYIAAFDNQSHRYIIEPQLINPQELIQLVKTTSLNEKNCQIYGNGIRTYAEKIDSQWLAEFAYPECDYPPATRMLELAKSGNFATCDAFNAELLYLRNKVAMNIEEQQQSKKS